MSCLYFSEKTLRKSYKNYPKTNCVVILFWKVGEFLRPPLFQSCRKAEKYICSTQPQPSSVCYFKSPSPLNPPFLHKHPKLSIYTLATSTATPPPPPTRKKDPTRLPTPFRSDHLAKKSFSFSLRRQSGSIWRKEKGRKRENGSKKWEIVGFGTFSLSQNMAWVTR